MRRTGIMLLVLAAVAWPLSKSYDVVPYKCRVGTAPGDPMHGVSQFYRNTLDSLSAVSVWIGDTFTSEPYKVEVLDSATLEMVAHNNQVHAPKMWAWTEFPLTKDAQPVRGRTYYVQVSRPTGGAISFAYCDTNPYKYGNADVPGSTPPLPAGSDVALRISGLLEKVDSTVWGATSIIPGWLDRNQQGQLLRGIWSDSMDSSGAHWGTFYAQWNFIKPYRDTGDYEFWDFDAHVRNIADSAGMEPVAVLFGTPKWASTRIDTFDTGAKFVDTSVYAAPRGIFDNDTAKNYWGEYLDSLLTHYDRWWAIQHPDSDTVYPANKVHTWSIWNESNEGATTYYRPDSWPGYTGWWRRPNVEGYNYLGPGPSDMCGLYVALCESAANAIHRHSGHENDRIVVGELCAVGAEDSSTALVPGKEWLRQIYAHAASRFWDVVSVHPYQGEDLFDPAKFADDAETLRAIMREHGDNSELWNSEFDGGIRSAVTAEQSANNLCEAFTSTPAQAGLPGGTFDRSCWWLSWQPPKWAPWGLFDSFMNPHPGFFAFKQVTRTLTGKRFNGRVTTGDAWTDTLVRMYEFETNDTLHRRTWVCWRNSFDGDGTDPRTPLDIPTTSNANDSTALDYDGSPPLGNKNASADGWARTQIGVRPVFFSEADPPSRPELVVDSLLVPAHPQVGSVMDVHAIVHNEGNSATPGLVRLDLLCNDDSFASGMSQGVIHVGDTCEYSFEINPIPDWMHGWCLFSARVNPGQVYVEKSGTDDNVGYVRRYVSGSLTGTLDVVSPPGGLSNEPLALVKLSSVSMEHDTSGQTPADSARVIQKRFSLVGDTLLDSTATAWFPFTSDTCVSFALGEGKYRLYAQYRDSAGTVSDTFGDTLHPIIVFDSTACAGSIEFNSGAHFTTSTGCSLTIAASDGLSGVHAMRIGRAEPVQLVQDCGFNSTASLWEYSSAGLDSGGLGMAVLHVTPDSTCWVR